MSLDLIIFFSSAYGASAFWYETFNKGLGNSELPIWAGLLSTVVFILSVAYQFWWYKKKREVEAYGELTELMTRANHNSLTTGEGIAEECFTEGLCKGMPLFLSQTETQIRKEFTHNIEAILSGFLRKMQDYVDSGVVVHFTTQTGEVMFAHKEHADRISEELKQ